jgi:hypothetical protein
MVCYVYDCSYVKVIHIKYLQTKTLDNEASATLKNFFTANDVEY